MRRPEFTPRNWDSENGEWTFYMGTSGAIDILPGPNHRFMRCLKFKGKVPTNPTAGLFGKGNEHIHWAS